MAGRSMKCTKAQNPQDYPKAECCYNAGEYVTDLETCCCATFCVPCLYSVACSRHQTGKRQASWYPDEGSEWCMCCALVCFQMCTGFSVTPCVGCCIRGACDSDAKRDLKWSNTQYCNQLCADVFPVCYCSGCQLIQWATLPQDPKGVISAPLM